MYACKLCNHMPKWSHGWQGAEFYECQNDECEMAGWSLGGYSWDKLMGPIKYPSNASTTDNWDYDSAVNEGYNQALSDVRGLNDTPM